MRDRFLACSSGPAPGVRRLPIVESVKCVRRGVVFKERALRLCGGGARAFFTGAASEEAGAGVRNEHQNRLGAGKRSVREMCGNRVQKQPEADENSEAKCNVF